MASPSGDRAEFPWWLVALVALCVGLGVLIWRDPVYSGLFAVVSRGIWMTVWVTLASFLLAAALGLAIAAAQLSRFRILRETARFYVQLIRGIPIIVILSYTAFVGVPALVGAYGTVAAPLIERGLLPALAVRDVDLVWRAVFALMIGYAAFLAEVFRAGFLSVGSGQIEAATALGLRRGQIFRLVTLPQAVPVVLPPLGNDFISMIKDSALVSAIGVADIAYMGKTAASTNFRFFETYNIVAFLYLVMTLGLSLGLGWIERRLRRRTERT